MHGFLVMSFATAVATVVFRAAQILWTIGVGGRELKDREMQINSLECFEVGFECRFPRMCSFRERSDFCWEQWVLLIYWSWYWLSCLVTAPGTELFAFQAANIKFLNSSLFTSDTVQEVGKEMQTFKKKSRHKQTRKTMITFTSSSNFHRFVPDATSPCPGPVKENRGEYCCVSERSGMSCKPFFVGGVCHGNWPGRLKNLIAWFFPDA